MRTQFKVEKNNHLILGAAAAGVALGLPRRSRWKLPLALIAALEVGQGLWKLQLQTAPDGGDGLAAPETSYRAVVEDIQMRWEEHGDGGESSIPVVMVHGIPTHPRLWRYVIPNVERTGVRCYAWELVGFGWSLAEGMGRDISVARQAMYLHSWLRHQGISRAVFVGHDIGGGVIQHLLTRHPELCQGLTLVDCVAYDNWPVAAVRLARAVNSLIEKLPPALVKPFFLAGLMNLGHDSWARFSESINTHWEPYKGPLGPKAFANQLRNMSAGDTLAVAGKLPRISAPAHVVWGEADPLGIASGERLAKELGARFSRIPRAPHFTPEDHPQIVAAAINQVLEEVMKQR